MSYRRLIDNQREDKMRQLEQWGEVVLVNISNLILILYTLHLIVLPFTLISV